MRKFLTIALLFACLCAQATTNVVTFNFVNVTNWPGSMESVQLIPDSHPVVWNGSLAQVDTLYFSTDTNGFLGVTNLAPTTYIVNANGPFAVTPFQITVPNTNGVFTFIQLMTTNQQPGQLVAYSKVAADANFTTYPAVTNIVNALGGGGGATLQQVTNAVTAGTNGLASQVQLANASNILNTAIGASTNALSGLSAFYPTNTFDLSGTAAAKATAATNALASIYGTAARSNANAFLQPGNNGSDFSSMVKAGSNITGIVSIKSFGALGGNNDDTAAFQAALNYAAPVWVDSTTNYTVKNLYPTNGSCLLGAASVIMFNTSSTGNMFSNSVAVTNVIFDRLTLFGQNFGFTGNGLSGGANSAPFDYVGGFIGTKQTVSVQRSGFMACSASPSSAIRNCRAVGFSDAGFRLYGNGTFPQPEYQSIKFIDNEATACWIGLDLTNSAEYLPIANFCTEACGQGIAIQSGNDLISGGQDTRDGVGVAVLNGTNPAHNAVNNRTMNHCYLGVMANGVAVGEMFNNCEIYASGIAITNSGGIAFQNCTLGGGGNFASISGFDIVIDGTGGGGLNYFVNNSIVAASLKFSTNGGGLFLVDGWKNQQGGWLPSTNSFPTIYTATNTFIGPVVTSGHLDTNTTTGNSVLVTNGNVTASGTITGNGSGLTALNGANVTATTLPESALNLTDITTANASTTKHGLLPKEDNNVAHYLDGTGGWSTPPGGSGIASSGGVATNLTIYGAEVNTNTSGNFTKSTNGTFTAGTSSGATITLNGSAGTVTATTFSGSGASLTSIPESGVTSLTTDLAAKAPIASPTFTGTATAGTFSGSGASLTSLPGANITAGTINSNKLDSATAAILALAGSGGTVTSVALTLPTALFNASIPGSPVTTSGTFTPSLATATSNTFFAGPLTGAVATPAFRVIGSNDLFGVSGFLLSNLNGANLVASTVNSNSLDAPTKAQLALAGTGGGSQTPWASDINAAGKSLTNASKGLFTNSVSAPYFAGSGITNTVVSGTAAGSTGAAYNTNTTDASSSGIVKLIVSGTGTGVGPLFTVTFGTPFTRVPKVTISAADANSASVTYNSGSIYVDFLTETTNGFSVFCTGTVNPATMYWVWHAEQ